MSLMDGIADGFRWLAGRETDLQTRSDSDGNPESLADLLARLGPTRLAQPWIQRTVREAMSVPAVFRAVSLISNTVGVLSMEAFRKGAKLSIEETPRLIVRPNPFTRPHVFYRDSAYSLCRRGEAWWWTAARDIDGSPLSLIPVDPKEILVEENPRDLRFPIITWRNRRMPNEDMTQITFLPDPNNPLRGIGPLQACGAAVSVAVEAMEWAANFFAGNGLPSVWIKSLIDITEEEAGAIKTQWVATPNNQPRVTGPAIDTITPFDVNAQSAQLTESREFQNGEVALMFGIPGSLLDHATPGASITYQNVGQEFDKFVRSCLWPNYLEPIEQAMSDLLTRSTVARFSVEGLLRADIRTRYDVYAIGIDKGILDAEEARQFEGLAPGDIENRPVPFAPPQAVPGSLPIQTRSLGGPVRCDGSRVLRGQLTACNRLLAENGPFVGSCPRCKKVHAAPAFVPNPLPKFRIIRTEDGATVEQSA